MNIINMYYTPLEARKLNLGALEIYLTDRKGKPNGVASTYVRGDQGDLTIILDGENADYVREEIEAILSIPPILA